MKVICIDNSPRYNSVGFVSKLIEGNIYETIGESFGRGTDGVYEIGYMLLEFGQKHVFLKDRFIPLSDIEESEQLTKNLIDESITESIN